MKISTALLLTALSTSAFSQVREDETSNKGELKLVLRSNSTNTPSKQRVIFPGVGSPYGSILPWLTAAIIKDNGQKYSCTANRSGECTLSGIPRGNYMINVSDETASDMRIMAISSTEDSSQLTIFVSKESRSARQPDGRSIRFGFRFIF